MPGSGRDDGIDFWIGAGTVEKPDVHKFSLRDSSLASRGDVLVERLTACIGEKRRMVESHAG